MGVDYVVRMGKDRLTMRPQKRTYETWYEDESGSEHNLTVEVCADGMRDIEILSELPDMLGAEEDRLSIRLCELYWADEREAYEMSQCAQEDSRDE